MLLLSRLLLSTLLYVAATALSQTCYFPDGTVSTDVPCSSDQYTSCCGVGDICLSNGYCVNTHQPYTLSRGSCTDQSWGPNCPQLCHGSSDGVQGGISLVALAYDNGKSSYCCGFPVDDGSGGITCPNGESSFTIPDGSIIFGRAGLANVTVNNTATGQASSPSSSSNSSSSPSSVMPSSVPSSIPSSSSSSSSSSDSSPGPSPSTCSSAKSRSSTEAAIGVGVGAPMAALAVASIMWGFRERRQRKRIMAMMEASRAAAATAVAQPSQSQVSWELENRAVVPEMMDTSPPKK